MTKIVFERLRVNEKKQITAGTHQLLVSNAGCSSRLVGVAENFPINEDARSATIVRNLMPPITVENRCYTLSDRCLPI